MGPWFQFFPCSWSEPLPSPAPFARVPQPPVELPFMCWHRAKAQTPSFGLRSRFVAADPRVLFLQAACLPPDEEYRGRCCRRQKIIGRRCIGSERAPCRRGGRPASGPVQAAHSGARALLPARCSFQARVCQPPPCISFGLGNPNPFDQGHSFLIADKPIHEEGWVSAAASSGFLDGGGKGVQLQQCRVTSSCKGGAGWEGMMEASQAGPRRRV